MALFLGLSLGAGLFLVWWSFWPREERPPAAVRDSRLRQLLPRPAADSWPW